MRKLAILLVLPALIAGCANVGLRDLKSTSKGPDEFGIKPVASLEEPTSYSELPAPTPGGTNRVDRSALAEGAQALGGNLGDSNGPIPARDSALVQHASRLGVSPNIRKTLAESDAAFRKRKARFTQYRIVPVDRYNQAYKRQALDAQAEQNRWRRAGARTPSAPPAN
ncbi:DUF3035 domain-containing protein [Sulfitobacter donghicola]|uniref:Pyruvate/2-oxoglutarate dehydrogenase complex, dihydrolipoamide acyltransferase (E2) component n=1 Tax=Sulfitobacter donghicola DSW-25 = KCTC 12864 = JCM 14565 TaxID=1300350 RepID=A0A073IYB8_9RHOB|nr:DUF3035 domain-containing protein [Sulfitobacter donghicola]KEJ90377.1 hypothetical protein DSW25_00195 [Sulfitobacter donghicola DSW-25 = KCTC 12864 = JCM 14565]KIN67604.1 DUF3035 domain containing protein [Sulfitobacter donghicola DSW-25 = KCTC 12864 = JCM 14565]